MLQFYLCNRHSAHPTKLRLALGNATTYILNTGHDVNRSGLNHQRRAVPRARETSFEAL